MDRKRAVLFFALLILPLFALEACLMHLQVLHPDEYAGSAVRHSVELAMAPRGRILDRRGRVLARDERSFDLHLVLEDFERRPDTRAALDLPGLDEEIEKIYRRIEKLMLRRPERERPDVYRRERRVPWLVHKGLSFEKAREIETHLDLYPGCVIRENLKRCYPEGRAAGTLLGTLGLTIVERDAESGEITRDDRTALIEGCGFEEYCDEETLQNLIRRGSLDQALIGRSGLERTCEERLRGRPGLLIQERDSASRLFSFVELVPGRPGEDLETTIDIDLQRHVEAVLAAVPTRATAVLLDPAGGEVLAMACNASVDPNHFVPPTNSAAIAAYLKDTERKPLLNHATQSQFQLGSIFKVVTAIAALEERRTGAARIVDCTGYFTKSRTQLRCWTVAEGHPPHGPLDLVGGLERSCNFYFFQMGHELGLGGLSTWASRLGFGRKSGIELPEVPGTLPAPSTHSRWRPSDSYSLAIGQHELMVTPVQVARMLAVVANGGILVRPHIVRGNGMNESLGISPATLALVRDGLRAVVHGVHGTAKNSGLARFDVAGKTSTAQTTDASHGERRESHAWFGGFTAKAVVVVLVEYGGHGGHAAAPVVARILEKLP